jgi:hypothetical protein
VVEVAHRAPGAAEALGGDVEHGRQRLVVGRHVGADGLLERRVGLGEQGVDRGDDVLGADGVEGRHAGGGRGQQGVRLRHVGLAS